MDYSNAIAVRANKTIYRDGDTVVKVFGEGFKKADVLNEALNQARVEETELNVPKLRGVGTTEDGKWYIASEYIPGRTLAELMTENPKKNAAYLEQFVDLQLTMHRQICPLLPRLRDKMDRKIIQTELPTATKYDLHTRLESMPRHNKLCHGDFNPTNVILREDGAPFIIDWSHATQGNASADAARTYLLFSLAGDPKTAEAYLTLFCDKSATPRQYVQKWIPIVAASQSVKGKPEERELLFRWVDVVDYE
ncbi:MAG: aminoglycoside phosphotransferase family protein [Clostridiales bacterium]|nr:aminoglycoside phosphotransferase family protein [Clostridiales bacterium]